MKLTVLGKYGPYAAAGGATSSYLVQNEKNNIALDFGSGALGRLQMFVSPLELDAIILSHLHYDHMCDLLPLSYCLKASGKKLKLLYPDIDCFQRGILDDLDGLELVPLGKNAEIGGFKIAFEKMQHPLESYSMKISCENRTLFYSGDTSFCPQLIPAAEGSDLLLLDCGKPENSAAPHLSLSEAADIAEALNTPVIASHLNPAFEYKTDCSLISIAEELKTYEV